VAKVRLLIVVALVWLVMDRLLVNTLKTVAANRLVCALAVAAVAIRRMARMSFMVRIGL
jgi:hypothetical protein